MDTQQCYYVNRSPASCDNKLAVAGVLTPTCEPAIHRVEPFASARCGPFNRFGRGNGSSCHRRATGRWIKAFDRVSDQLAIDPLLDRRQDAAFARDDEREGDAVAAHPTRSTDAVNVIVAVLRNVIIDDVRDRTDIDTTADDIGSDQDFEFPIAEFLQHAITFALRHVAMHATGVRELLRQFSLELIGAAPRAAENDRLFRLLAFEQPNQQIEFLVSVDGEVALFDRFDCHRVGAAVDHQRFVHVRLGQPTDRWRQGRREQQRLAVFRAPPQDPFDLGAKADVEHSVSFVEHDAPHRAGTE